MKYTINELANSKGVSQLVREALLQMEAELDATNRQVEILSDALAESRREVAAPVREDWGPGPHEYHSLPAQRQWVGLTDEEIQVVLDDPQKYYDTMNDFARAIEAKLKEKNT
jgi:hypothetical protein